MNAQSKLIMALSFIVCFGEPVELHSQQQLMHVVRQCNENAIELRLDPGPFQNFLGPNFALALAEGKARVVIVVHDCSQIWVDGQDFGPAQEVRVWVSIRGSEEVRPVVGAELTRPTQTWFALFEGTSNLLIRKAKIAAGTTERLVDSVVLDPLGPRRGGRAYLSGDMEFSWHLSLPAPPSVRLVGLNNDVYTRDSMGNVVLNQIQSLMHVSADPSAGTLAIVGPEGVVPLLKPGTYPILGRVFLPMWSRATLGLSPLR